MTITRDYLKGLEAQRPQANVELHYTIGGSVETEVHSSLQAELTGAINQGYRHLAEASQNFNHDLKAAIENRPKPIDTDLGYGASESRPFVEEFNRNNSPQRVDAFLADMMAQKHERERQR